MSARIALRPETAGDLAFRLALFEAVRGPEWAGITLPPQLVQQQFQAQTAGYGRRFPEARLSIIEVDDVPVGRLAVDRDDRALRLIDIAVLPARQGQGIGAQIIGGLLAEATALGLAVHLSATVANRAAQRLYRRLGFTVVSQTDTDVEMVWSGSGP